jgi:flagellar biosynthesis protein FlhF
MAAAPAPSAAFMAAQPVRRASPQPGRPPAAQDQVEMMQELRSMRGLIEQRFGALAFMEKLQRQPRQATLTQKLLDTGFSPALIRKLVDGLPRRRRDRVGHRQILQRNLRHRRERSPLEDQGGVYALIGSTGVGKTTSTAKLAAAFRHPPRRRQPGPDHARRLPRGRPRAAARLRPHPRRAGAHRARPRLAGRPAGPAVGQEDGADRHRRHGAARRAHARTAGHAEHRAVNRLLVINAASQGETIEDVLSPTAPATAAASSCRRSTRR